MNRKKIVTLTSTLLCGVIMGIGLMQIDPVYSSVQSALGKENTHNTIYSNGLYFPDMSSMDLETALKVVQEQRTQLLNTQLQDQITAVNSRNTEITKLFELLNKFQQLNTYFAQDAKANTSVPNTANQLVEEINQSITRLDESLQASGLKDYANKKMVKSDVDHAITRIKDILNSIQNSQQMDMQRLQSMSHKRNEAFDVMTNFIKKMQDSRNQIIGNMR